MKSRARIVAYHGIWAILALGLMGCALNQSDPGTNARPACVGLESYSYVIEQVMKVQPDWKLLEQTTDSYQYQWTIEDRSGKHTLTTALTSDGCVCGTVASSQFRMGGGKEKMVGLLQGAAVAPVSELNYTSTWLEPKIALCGIAYFFRRPYEAETIMKDGTTWRLTCSSNASPVGNNSLYTFTISAPGCVDILEIGR